MSEWKEKLKQHPERFEALFWLYNHVAGGNRFCIKGQNVLYIRGALLRGCRVRVEGENNEVHISPLCRLTQCEIHIRGNNNRLYLGAHCNVAQTRFCLEDDANSVALGTDCMLVGPTELAATEGTTLTLGAGCMLSANTDVRTGDSHALYDAEGARCNAARDVCLEEQVWLGNRAMVLKGVRLARGCVVGAGSVVTRACAQPECVLAGNPAEIKRRGVRWTAER